MSLKMVVKVLIRWAVPRKRQLLAKCSLSNSAADASFKVLRLCHGPEEATLGRARYSRNGRRSHEISSLGLQPHRMEIISC